MFSSPAARTTIDKSLYFSIKTKEIFLELKGIIKDGRKVKVFLHLTLRYHFQHHNNLFTITKECWRFNEPLILIRRYLKMYHLLFGNRSNGATVKNVNGRGVTLSQIKVTVAQREFAFGRSEIVQPSTDLDNPAIV
jgi:hypothetical protein